MSIATRFGEEITLVRRATLDDLKTFEGRSRRIDKHDRERTSEGWRAIAKYADTGKEILVDAAYVRATGGWTEIEAAFKALAAVPS